MWARRSGRAQFVAGDGPLVQAFGMFQTPDIEGKLLWFSGSGLSRSAVAYASRPRGV